MTFARLTPLFFALSLLAAAGCTNGGSSNNAAADASPAAPAAPAPPAAPATGDPGKSPCDLPGGWYFRGTCVLEPVSASGATFTLRAYRGVGIELTYGASDAKGKVPFIAADAIGDGDVTGLLNGSIAFQPFGSNCLTMLRKPVACTGKALVYYIVANGGKTAVRFKESPAIFVTSEKGFPGSDCGIDTMVWSDARSGKAAWVLHPYASAPAGQQFRAESRAVPQTYRSGGSFAVFAVVCG